MYKLCTWLFLWLCALTMADPSVGPVINIVTITLMLMKPEYSRWTLSIPWLLFPWLLPSPGHQQSWYWLCRIHWPSSWFLPLAMTDLFICGTCCILCEILVMKPEHSRWTRSIPWLLMPWLLLSPGHQQPWHWLCRINWFMSFSKKDFNYMFFKCWEIL